MSKLPNIKTLLQALRGNRRANSSERDDLSGEMPPIDERITDTGYYSEISFRYHSAQIVCIMLLAVFLFVSLMTDARALSADNLVYFAKDLATTIADREKEATDTFVYAADKNNACTLYREGLVVLGRQKLTVFTATGREAHSHLLSYQNPRLASSGRFLAAYDLGGKSVSLYNSFTQVNDITTEHAVRAMAICNKGYYCLITDGDEYPSEVLLYNDRHRMINRYRLQEYTVCADLRQDGSELMLTSVSAVQGRMVTHIAFAVPGKTEWGYSFEVNDAYPVASRYNEDGNISLLTTDALIVLSPQGEEISRYLLSPNDVLSYRLSEEGCVLVCRDQASDRSCRVLTFDKNGNLEYNISVSDVANDVYCVNGSLAVLLEGRLLLFRDPEEGEPTEVSFKGGYHTILAYNDQEFLLCGEAKAIAVKP